MVMQLMQKKYKSMAESALLLKIIKHLPIFAGCPDFFQNNILINKILKEIKLVHHEKNAVLYKAGDPLKGFYIIVQGSVYCLTERVADVA